MKKMLVQAVKFVGLSGMGWILDFCIYTALGHISGNLVWNNIISSWCGITFVFISASGRVFKDDGKIPLKWKYLIYLLYQVILIFFISNMLNGINTVIVNHVNIGLVLKFSNVISKIAVTPITMILNFFVMKGVIEKL